uniref:Uncharacterized protein n=1 Tax=Arundo donax TaxID=35708 RepID=A0A0A8ZV97_ARUDO
MSNYVFCYSWISVYFSKLLSTTIVFSFRRSMNTTHGIS